MPTSAMAQATPDPSDDAVDKFQKAPVAPGDWHPGMPVVVVCQDCRHEWVYAGQTQYAQCKCGRSNPVIGGHYE